MKGILSFSLVFVILCTIPIYAAFQFYEVGARPLGMSGAFSSIADDSNSPVWNVAGLGQIQKLEFTAMYAQFYTEIMDDIGLGFVSLTYPHKWVGTFGISYINLGYELYREETMLLSYANRIPNKKPFLLVGVNVKFLQKKYGRTGYTDIDPTFKQKMGADGISYDVGLIYLISRTLFCSLVGKNVNKPNVSLLKKDYVPAEYVVGLSYRFGKSVLSVDSILMDNSSQDRKVTVGTETWFLKDKLGLRGGISRGTNEYLNLALGASYMLSTTSINLQIDYAFTYNLNRLVSMNTNNHYISLSMKL